MQTVILLFDAVSPVLERVGNSLQNPDPECLGDPFWVYARVAADIVGFQDSAVWAIRDQVRTIEKQVPSGKPQPDYRHLHDVARHAVHVSETIDVVTETLNGILAQHEDFISQINASQVINDNASDSIHRQLLFCKDMIKNLGHRSFSNRERLQNEIQLAFNTVAQYDAGITVDIGRAAQNDSAAMKTIAYVTMTFLPATFISALFSMSFFDFDAEANIWSMSSKFWVYWACAIPTTLVTFILWHFWHKIFPLRPAA